MLILGGNSILYYGINQRGTQVFTWVAASEEGETSFSEDVAPLLSHLLREGLVSSDSHIGVIGFGTESFHSQGEVTFSAEGYNAEIRSGPAPSGGLIYLPPADDPWDRKKKDEESGATAWGRSGRLRCRSLGIGALAAVVMAGL